MNPPRKAAAPVNLDTWRLAWRVALDRPLLPVSWPGEFGGTPRDDQCCGCCRRRGWHGSAEKGWVCNTCHPPADTAAAAVAA